MINQITSGHESLVNAHEEGSKKPKKYDAMLNTLEKALEKAFALLACITSAADYDEQVSLYKRKLSNSCSTREHRDTAILYEEIADEVCRAARDLLIPSKLTRQEITREQMHNIAWEKFLNIRITP